MQAIRVGHGFDTHRFSDDPNRKLMLGGLHIPDAPGLMGHSDADALLHAICDAILGALGLGDIGTYFPDTDSKHKNQDSSEFLTQIYAKATEQGYQLGNLDVTMILEKPKMQSHIERICRRIAEILYAEQTQINVKATRNEGMGHLGRAEGVAVHAVVFAPKARIIS